MEENIQMSAEEVLQRLHADDSGNSYDEDVNASSRAGFRLLLKVPTLRIKKATMLLAHLLLHTLMEGSHQINSGTHF